MLSLKHLYFIRFQDHSFLDGTGMHLSGAGQITDQLASGLYLVDMLDPDTLEYHHQEIFDVKNAKHLYWLFEERENWFSQLQEALHHRKMNLKASLLK